MRRNGLLLAGMALIGLLLAASILFVLFRDEDPHRFYTGLGESLSVSPDDRLLAFSYFQQGREAIYTARPDGTQAEKLLDSDEPQTMPSFSPDGKGMVYLSSDDTGIQAIYYKKLDSDQPPKQLTKRYLQVYRAIFSHDGSLIYFVAKPVEDGLLPEDITDGSDLYAVDPNGGNLQKLTDTDAFLTGGLAVSPDPNKIYFTAYGETEELFAFNLRGKTEQPVFANQKEGMFDPVFSPDGKRLAYVSVGGKSDSGEFEYELFIRDMKTGASEQMTREKAGIAAPVFFRHSNQAVFLKQHNWPDQAAAYDLMAIDLESGIAEQIKIDMPLADVPFNLLGWLHQIVNFLMITILYILLFLFWILHRQLTGRRFYLPALVSVLIAVLAVASAWIVGLLDPWNSMVLVEVSRYLLFAAGVILMFAFLFWTLVRNRRAEREELERKSV